MRGYRKISLGLAYLAAATWLGHKAIAAGVQDFTSLGILFTGLATGVGAVVWGNVRNHATDSTRPPQGPTPSP